MLDTLHGAGRGFTIACPAFPDNQRTVFKGHLFVGDQLLSDSGMRGHPLTPTTDANLVRVLQRQSRRRAGLVAHDTVVRGAAAIGERFAALQAEDVQITVVDAVSNADLLHIGAAPTGMRLVTAGSGIAIGLPSNATRADAPHAAGGLRAIVSGGRSVTTNAQVEHFKDAGGAALAIDPLALADEGADPVAQALDWACPRLADAPVLVYATAAPQAVQAAQARLGRNRGGQLVEQALARIAVGLARIFHAATTVRVEGPH